MFVTFTLLLVLTLFAIGIGYVLGRRKGMIIAFGIALLMNGYSYWFSDSLVLSYYKAQPVEENHRLYRITKSIAQGANLPMPTVYRIPSETPNAFATGRSPANAAVAATDGILKLLSDEELRGVMAHELGHVVNRDTLISTVAASVTGGIMLLSRFALWFGSSSSQKGEKSGGGFITTIAVAIIAPIAAQMIHLAISREREYEADEYGGRLTKHPLKLATALQKLQRGVAQTPMNNARPETAHLFIVNPFSNDFSMARLFSTHPPMKQRVKRLKALHRELSLH